MFGAPANVPLVGCRALIALVSYVQWLQGVVGGLSIPYWSRGVKISLPFSELCLPHSPLVIERRNLANLASYPDYVKLSHSFSLFS